MSHAVLKGLLETGQSENNQSVTLLLPTFLQSTSNGLQLPGLHYLNYN